MSTSIRAVCDLGLTDRTLSAWRDDALRDSERARLAAHVADCPACRERLAELGAIAAALRSERPPEPDGRLWQAIAAAAASAPARQRRLGARPLPLGRLPWSGLGAVAAVLLLVLGFAQLFAMRGAPTARPTTTATASTVPTSTPLPTATPSSTPALLPARPLSWRTVTLPAGSLYGSLHSGTPAVAFAGDGETAYTCGVTAQPALRIWVTHDRGRNWSSAQVIPPTPSVNGCELVADTSDPSVAALCWAPRGGGAGDSCTGWMTTVDGGVTWQALPYQPFVAYNQLDSRAGVIYALRETPAGDGSVAYHLWASHDSMRTWRQMDHGLPADVAGFWLQPDSPSILAVLSGGAYGFTPTQLWSSPDDGATWRRLDVPAVLPTYTPARFRVDYGGNGGIFVSARSGQPWRICVANISAQNPASNSLTCTADGGRTWQPRPLLNLFPIADGLPSHGLPIGIADDGAFLVTAETAEDNGGSLLYTLFRLPAGADRWQPLGRLPQFFVTYCPGGGTTLGTLWATSAPGINPDPRGRIYTADYAP